MGKRTARYRSTGRITLLLLLSSLVLGVCTTGGTTPAVSPTPTPISHPTGPQDLVLRIETSGGLIPRLLNEFPELSVYGDGTIVTLGPQVMIYPPPVLPNLVQSRTSEEGLQILLQEAAAAGLLAGDADYPLPGVYDAPTTFFTVNAGGRTSRVSVYALGIEEADDPRLAPEQREARRKLAEFARKARDFLTWLPPETIREQEAPYPITRLQLVIFPADAPEVPQPAEEQFRNTRPWPLATPLADLGAAAPWAGASARCAVIAEPSELSELLRALRTASLFTHWQSDSERFWLVVRPLLPDEAGCAPRSW